MKILKPGRPERARKQRELTCFFCKCEYLAEVGEFTLEPYTLHGAVYYEVQCMCPECGAKNTAVLLEDNKEG